MSLVPESADAPMEERVLDAALAELAVRSVADFRMSAVAARAGVDERTLLQWWPNSNELLAAALMAFGARHLRVPDTGTLYGDLLAYAKGWAVMVDSPLGRRLLDAVIVRPQDWDLTDARRPFLARRGRRMAEIVARGVERGECRADVDPAKLIDLIAFGICLPVLFYDRYVTADDCEYVVNLVVHGVRPR